MRFACAVLLLINVLFDEILRDPNPWELVNVPDPDLLTVYELWAVELTILSCSSRRHLPHGFYEDQLKGNILPTAMLSLPLSCFRQGPRVVQILTSSSLVGSGFFTQFGRVTKVRLSRNKKTGKAKHYAFLEFQYPEVAAVAATAMDGYMLFKQKLSVHVMPAKVRRALLCAPF